MVVVMPPVGRCVAADRVRMTQQVVNPLLIKPTPSPFQHGSSVAGDIVGKVNAWRDRIERVELHLGNACGRRK